MISDDYIRKLKASLIKDIMMGRGRRAARVSCSDKRPSEYSEPGLKEDRRAMESGRAG